MGGYSRDEIALASFTAKRIREQRERTIRQIERTEAIRFLVDKLPFVRRCCRGRSRRRQQRKQNKQKQDDENQVATSYFVVENSSSIAYSSSSSSSSLTSLSSSISETGTEKMNKSSLSRRRGHSLHAVAVAPTTSADDNNYYSEEFPKAA